MPQSLSDLTSSITNHNIKQVYHNKHKNHMHQHKVRTTRPRSSTSSSSASSSPSISSSSGSIDTTLSSNEVSHHAIGSPTLQQIEWVRHAWERVCELRQEKDSPSVSPAHAFGLLFYKALFDLDPALKSKLGNVMQQARVLAAIMSYLTRSPTIKGEAGSLKELNPRSDQKRKNKTPSGPDDECDATDVYVDLLEHQATLSKTSPPPPPPIHHRQHSTEKQFNDDVCPFYQQEQEEKYQQQLLHQQQQQQEQERQRTSIQKDRQYQLQRKIALQHQEDNHWFAYKLRELGVQYVEEYDLDPENLDAFRPALSSALKARLNDELTPAIGQAWNQVANFTFYHIKTGVEAHVAYHRRARRLSSGSYCSIEAGETNGACTIQ
ncbi:hypothetical protein BC941DRAFT_473558 [Chlamydoabsidia padenii]|nr:hypothetical protein BC941DRAFT_473558 [Chlamydoabsidia padenii]